MVALSVAAAVTDTLRIGMLVLGNDYKHPAVVAKEAATLDLLSDGRLEFGLGAGLDDAPTTPRSAFRTTRHRTRIERLGEAIEVVKGCWADGPFDFDGRALHDPRVRRAPEAGAAAAPADPRRRGRASACSRSPGREADIVGINPNLRAGEVNADVARSTLARGTEQKIDWVRDGRRRALRRDRAADPLLPGRDHRRRARARRSARARASASTPTTRSQSGSVLVGTVDEVCDTLVRAARRVGRVVRRGRRRPVRSVRARRRSPRRHLRSVRPGQRAWWSRSSSMAANQRGTSHHTATSRARTKHGSVSGRFHRPGVVAPSAAPAQ